MNRSPIFFFVAILSPSFALAQLVDSKTFVTPKASVTAQKIAPGDKFDVTVTGEIQKGIHIQEHKPTENYLIPTVLTLEKADGLSFSEVQYPKPVSRTYKNISDEPLLVYEDKLVLKFSVTIAKDAAAGKREIHGFLNYQGCDDNVCYPPQKAEIKIPIEIVAPR